MRRYFTQVLFLGLCLVLVQSEAYATILTSVVRTVRVNVSPASPARTSIQMIGATPCASSGWFAFENAHTGVGRLWTDLAIAASQGGKQLTVVGTGVCDGFSVEGVSHIDLK